MIEVAPSLLAADFGRLNDAMEIINGSEASLAHVDVMDGVFVPNISMGFPIIEALSRVARKPLDVHLMIVEPHKYITRLRDLGVSIVNVHYEACTHLNRVVEEIRRAGMSPAVTLNPATPVEMLRDILGDIDMVLLMSVNPGFGGQAFIERTIDKVRRLRGLIEETESKVKIEIDGGVNLTTGRRLAEAGADILVAGSYVFKASDPYKAISELRAL